MGFANGVRRTARTTAKVWNFCLNPACLHVEPARGCACCARGHKRKK